MSHIILWAASLRIPEKFIIKFGLTILLEQCQKSSHLAQILYLQILEEDADLPIL